MLKRDLVVRLQQEFPQHLKQDIETVVDMVFHLMTTALKNRQRIEIRGIGSFSLHRQKGRNFVNPKTGSTKTCRSNHRIVFKAGKDLKSNIPNNVEIRK